MSLSNNLSHLGTVSETSHFDHRNKHPTAKDLRHKKTDHQEIPNPENQDAVHCNNTIPSTEAADEISIQDHNMMIRYQTSDGKHTVRRRAIGDRSSAPPQSLGSLHDEASDPRFRYLDQFSKEILPPPTAPAYLQIVTYMQRWGVWAAVISDEQLRERLIKAVTDKMENVWMQGMRQGLIPQNIETTGEVSQDTVPAQDLAKDIIATTSRVLGQQQRRRRPLSPTRQIAIKPRAEKRFKYAITFGELKEAGVTVDMINQRIESGDLDDDDELMQDILEQANREVIDAEDWYGVLTKTKYNTMGRDLMVYCLWEVQNSRREIVYLENLRNRFTVQAQKRNTQVRIDLEKELHDQMHALALILHESAPRTSPNFYKRSESVKAASVKSDISGESTADPNSALGHEENHRESADNQVEVGSAELLPVARSETVLDALDENVELAQAEMPALGAEDVVMTDAEDGERRDKRYLAVDDSSMVQPRKKIKALDWSPTDMNTEIQPIATSTISTTMPIPGRDLTPASMSPSLTTDGFEPQIQQFIDSDILPRLNELLKQNSHGFIPDGTSWQDAKIHLRQARITHEVRNQFAREIVKFRESLRKESGGARTQQAPTRLAAPDLPSRNEIAESIPTEGLSPYDFYENFKNRVDPNDPRWPELVRSVAYRDKVKNLWFTLNMPIEEAHAKCDKSPPVVSESPTIQPRSRQSMIISPYFNPNPGHGRGGKSSAVATIPGKDSLGLDNTRARNITPKIKLTVHKRSLRVTLKTKSGFRPSDYSSRVVNNTRGFRWRYIEDSTVAERDSMDHVIQTYVKDRIDFDREKRQKWPEGDIRGAMPDRFGKYEVLAHPNVRGEGRGKGLVHGIWDYRNKSKVSGANWFYHGQDGEWVYPVKEFDNMGNLVAENWEELDEQAGPSAVDANRSRQQRNNVIVLDGTIDSEVNGKMRGQGARKLDVKGKGLHAKLKSRRTPPPPSLTRDRMTVVTGKKRKTSEVEVERPKRQAALVRTRYLYGDGEEADDDDEYMPGRY